MHPLKKELFKRELATRDLFSFVNYTKPDFVAGWFNRELAAIMDQFVTDVHYKKSPRIIVTIAPRFGKSEYVSRRLPAYTMAKYPGLEFIGATHTQMLADTNGADVRDIILDPRYKDLFNVEIDDRFTARDFMRLANGSSFRSVGIGAGLPGFGANILSIDDFFRNREDADSKTVRDSVWNWLKGVAFNRLMPGGGVILTATRWHVDDPIGRILSNPQERQYWTVFEYPAIAEKDEPHRKLGESLHPERWSVEELMIRKRETDARGWAALFQGRPYLEEGSFFRKEHLQWYEELPKNLKYLVAADYSTSARTSSDHTCIMAAGLQHDKSVYIHPSVTYDRLDPLVAVQKTVKLAKSLGTNILCHEKGVIANTLEPVFKIVMQELGHYLIMERYTRNRSKDVHANAIRGMMEAKKVWLPLSCKQWMEPLLLGFDPKSEGEDDLVDALASVGIVISNAVVAPPLPELKEVKKVQGIWGQQSDAFRQALKEQKEDETKDDGW